MTTSVDWPAPAKINLFLHVTGRRADGYHLLQTLFQFVDWCDWLDFAPRSDGVVARLSELPGVAPAAKQQTPGGDRAKRPPHARRGAHHRITVLNCWSRKSDRVSTNE